ncbi:hypothetical protein VTN96DRAFT_5115 [Rasamsonia emersonii]
MRMKQDYHSLPADLRHTAESWASRLLLPDQSKGKDDHSWFIPHLSLDTLRRFLLPRLDLPAAARLVSDLLPEASPALGVVHKHRRPRDRSRLLASLDRAHLTTGDHGPGPRFRQADQMAGHGFLVLQTEQVEEALRAHDVEPALDRLQTGERNWGLMRSASRKVASRASASRNSS